MPQKRNRTIDFLKGISILLVLITHYAWTAEQRSIILFPYLIDMAVPVFMIISGYVGALSFRNHEVNTFSDAYMATSIARKVIRYSVPFLIIVLWQIFDPNVVINVSGKLEHLRWFLNGTVGQGSYYFPILIQLVFIFPVVYFIIERKGQRGLWICLIINAVYELLKWSYGMNDECYRLLIFRYIFVIAAGVYASKYELKGIISIGLTVVGGVFLWITTYNIYTPYIITSWTSTCFIAVMWIIPVTLWIIKKDDIRFKPLELIGHASYNIFLVQMVYYRSYRAKLVPSFDNWIYEMIVGMIICLVVGYIFYLAESRITKAIVKKSMVIIEHTG